MWHFQPFPSPDALNRFVVHMLASIVQEYGHHPIAIPAIGLDKRQDVVGEPFLIRPALWNLTLGRAVFTEGAAGPAL